MTQWNNIINLENLDYQSEYKNEHYQYQFAALASKMGCKKLGFHVEILPPKAFSCPYHYHHSEEELFLILEGEATLRQNQKFKKVKKGDLIFFEPTPQGAHQFYNHSSKPFQFLALSTLDPLEVVEYPDSKKISVVKLKKTFQENQSVDYFKDEENPTLYWPPEFL
jgi:uncharacterized cupin superfamily protein